jgi:hypothetical protein
MASLAGKRTVGVGLLLLVALLLLAGCASSGPSSNTQGTSTAYAPLNLRFDADRYEFTTPSSMCSTVLTAEVVIGTHGQSFWNSSNGLRPRIADPKALVQQGYKIYTPVTFSSLHALVDHRPQTPAAYVSMGGQVGQDQFSIDPFPQVADGKHYLIVFGPANEPAVGKVAKWLVICEAYPIDAQGNVTLQQAGSPNEPGTGQPQSEIKLSLTSLRQQWAACH